MDHIDQLPGSGAYDAIFVLVNRLTSVAHFVLTTAKATLQDLAKEYRDHVFKLYGAPSNTVFN